VEEATIVDGYQCFKNFDDESPALEFVRRRAPNGDTTHMVSLNIRVKDLHYNEENIELPDSERVLLGGVTEFSDSALWNHNEILANGEAKSIDGATLLVRTAKVVEIRDFLYRHPNKVLFLRLNLIEELLPRKSLPSESTTVTHNVQLSCYYIRNFDEHPAIQSI
jgi:hypothetical protein